LGKSKESEGIAVSTKYFTFSKPPVFSAKVTERFKISSDPIGKDGDATLNQFSPAGEIVSYTAQASELSMEGHPGKQCRRSSVRPAVTQRGETRDLVSKLPV